MSASPERHAYTVAQAAEHLEVCRATIYNLIARGELRAIKIGRATRILAPEIAAFESRGGAA